MPITEFVWSRQSDGWASWPIIVLKLKTSQYVECWTFGLSLRDKKIYCALVAIWRRLKQLLCFLERQSKNENTLLEFFLHRHYLHSCHTLLCLVEINCSRTSREHLISCKTLILFILPMCFSVLSFLVLLTTKEITQKISCWLYVKYCIKIMIHWKKISCSKHTHKYPLRPQNQKMLSIRTKEVVILVFEQSWFMFPVIFLGERETIILK